MKKQLLTDSMEPLYKKGSLVWANAKIHADSTEIGDVLIYRSDGGNLVMHRLVDAAPSDEGSIKATLCGDANEDTQDITLSSVNYIGREAFSIPWLGDFVTCLLSIKWVVWVISATFIILACIPSSSNLSHKERELQ